MRKYNFLKPEVINKQYKVREEKESLTNDRIKINAVFLTCSHLNLDWKLKEERYGKELGGKKYYLYPSHKQFPELELET